MASVTAAPTMTIARGDHSRFTFLPHYRLLLVTLANLYGIALVLSLKYIIAPLFTYLGFGYHAVHDVRILVWMWGLVFIASWCLPIQLHKPSAFFTWLIYLAVWVPAILMPPFTSHYVYAYVPMQAVLFFAMMALCGVNLLPVVRLPEPKWSFKLFVIFLFAYSGLILLWLIANVGLPTSVPSLLNPYQQRAAFSAAIAGSGPFLYLVKWQTAVINPLLILIGAARRKWIIFAAGVGIIFLMYAMAGHKSYFGTTALVLAVYVALTFPPRFRSVLMVSGALSVIVFCSAVYWLTGSINLISILVRRMLMMPGLLTGYYHEYFTAHGFTGRFGPLSAFLATPPMDLTTPRTIGEVYFGRSTVAANANFWADAYSAIGYQGVILATILAVVILWTIDSIAISRNLMIATPIFVVVLFGLVNSALPITLLTHGLLISIIMVWALPGADDTRLARNHDA
ncbi:MAG: hypothetical protein KC435_08265 [Thermomicrobiales bacterium]|nr:hypothetical protein [Thermomicrobiales bacterium]